MSETWIGPRIGNPNAQRYGRWNGLLFDQSREFQAAVESIRAQRKSWEPGYVPMPDPVELTMANGTKITGTSSQETASLDPVTNEVHVFLSQWDSALFTWASVTIKSVELKVEVRINPAEPGHESDPRNPMVIIPAPDPED